MGHTVKTLIKRGVGEGVRGIYCKTILGAVEGEGGAAENYVKIYFSTVRIIYVPNNIKAANNKQKKLEVCGIESNHTFLLIKVTVLRNYCPVPNCRRGVIAGGLILSLECNKRVGGHITYWKNDNLLYPTITKTHFLSSYFLKPCLKFHRRVQNVLTDQSSN